MSKKVNKLKHRKTGLAVFVLVAGVTLTACNSSTTNDVQSNNGSDIITHEENKLENGGDITESDKVDKEDTVVTPEYTGNRYENKFVGLRMKYPENWFSTDSYDVLLNVMKELGVNDKLDLTTTKLKSPLSLVTFESNDNYGNTLDIIVLPSLASVTEDLSESKESVDDDKTSEEGKTSEKSKDTSEVKNETPKEVEKEVAKENTETNITEIPKYTEADLLTIKEEVIKSMGSEDNMVSCEEPYLTTIEGREVAIIEFVISVYGQELSMVSGFLNLGANHLMIASASINEPNEVDKIYNIEEIVATLEIGFDLDSIDSNVLAPVKGQTDDEVLKDLEEGSNEDLDNLDGDSKEK